jgi:molybdopterin-guanine dinucleotide biosynthesis protein A
MNLETTAIILSGGKSSRIGQDKALLKIGNLTIIERIYLLLKEIFENVIIISNTPENYNFLDVKIYKDIFPGFGPLSGIHSGLVNSNTEMNFFISCDMPLISKEFIEFLMNINFDEDILIPTSLNNYHTLCAGYKKICLSKAENLLKSSHENMNSKNGKTKVKLFDLINFMNTKFIDITNEKFFNDNIIFNMNTLEDYEFVKGKIE